MVFSSNIFLFFFLPIVIFLYSVSSKGFRPFLLLLGSLFFYTWAQPKALGILFIVCLINYIAAIWIEKAENYKRYRKSILILTCLFDISVLGYYKYLNFFIDNINSFFYTHFPLHDLILPAGISFFIFQIISYVADVYFKKNKAQHNLNKFILYISFFPQMIAGPIIRYKDMEKNLDCKNSSFDDIIYGTKRFVIGLGKKVLLANSLANIADSIFNSGFSNIGFGVAWLGAMAYSLQIYFDFSGYSDMAIGLGRIFGFHFPENFNFPYISKSITEFWRRWHISLGSWFRDYVYIPLGGNRKGKLRTYINLGLVFLVTGMWHGANWTFILWGIWHGLFVIVERLIGINKWPLNKNAFIRYVYTTFAFVIGWTMFRANSVTDGLGFISTMLGFYTPEYELFTIDYYLTFKNLVILIVSIFFCTPFFNKIATKYQMDDSYMTLIAKNGCLIIIFVVSIIYMAASTYTPFIYFQF